MQQFSQGPSMDPNFAYASGPNQQFAHQLANQFTQQYSQNMNIPQRQYSGYSTNVASNNVDLQARGQYYNSQQHPYTTYQTQQPGYYGQMSGNQYQQRVGAPYAMPRVQVENVHSAPGLMSVSPQCK